MGSNDLDFEEDEDPVITKVLSLVEQCKAKWPETKVIVGEILPRFYKNKAESQNFERKRINYNSKLADKSKTMDFLVVEHNNLSQIDFQDGIHLNDIGVPTFVKNIKNTLDPLLGIHQDQAQNDANSYARKQFNSFSSRRNYPTQRSHEKSYNDTRMYDTNRYGRENNDPWRAKPSDYQIRQYYNTDRSYEVRGDNSYFSHGNREPRYEKFERNFPRERQDYRDFRYDRTNDEPERQTSNSSNSDVNHLMRQLLYKLSN